MALIVAHRGAWGEAPQNSLAALQAAIDLGCEMVECDVRATADRRLAVVHDPRVGATAVSSLTLAELRERLADEAVPEFEELVALAAGRIALDVELKEDDRVDAVLAVLARHLTPDQYVLTSFLESALLAVRVLAPEVRTGLLIAPGPRPRRLEARLDALGAAFVAPHASLARAGLLTWAQRREYPSYVWTVNEPRLWRLLLPDPRVDAVITDRPAEALAARRELTA